MKSTLLTFVTLLPFGTCFSPYVKPETTRKPTCLNKHSNKVGEITHELQELGQEIKPHVIDHESHGFERKESLTHRLRQELHKKDKIYHELLDEMERVEKRQSGMTDLKGVLEQTLAELQQQNAMLRHKKDVSKKQEDTLHELLSTIKDIHDNLVQANAFAMAWETAEVELWREKREHEKLDKERQSVRSLLWQAVKITGRRIKKVFKRILFLK